MSHIHASDVFRVQLQISNIKKFTTDGQLFEALETFTPKATKPKTLQDFFNNQGDHTLLIDKVVDDKNSLDKKRPLLESLGGFVTATQFEECKKLKLASSQTTISSFYKCKSEVITNVVVDKQENVNGETSELTNNMEDKKNKVEKLKILFGDESDGEKECKKREEDDKRDHKHSKRKHHDRKRKIDSKTDDVCSDKKQCTNETNGASGSVDVAKREENNKRRVKLKKSEIGTLVVKLLTPAYAERRFDSRDTFKSMARSISHALLDKGGFDCYYFLCVC